MDSIILESIRCLYKKRLFAVFQSVGLGCLCIITGLIVGKYIKFPKELTIMLIGVTILTVVLFILQMWEFIPAYKDYCESAYVVLENATVTIVRSRYIKSGSMDKALVEDSKGQKYQLTIPTDPQLEAGETYTGMIAYLKHSKHLVYYSFDCYE